MFAYYRSILPHRSTLQGNFFTPTRTSLTSTIKLCALFIFNNDLPISLGLVSLSRATLQRLRSNFPQQRVLLSCRPVVSVNKRFILHPTVLVVGGFNYTTL